MARLDLALEVVDSSETLELMLQYNADLFAERTAQQIARHFLARPALLSANPCERRHQAER